jgi:hypothetical protein
MSESAEARIALGDCRSAAASTRSSVGKSCSGNTIPSATGARGSARADETKPKAPATLTTKTKRIFEEETTVKT